MGLDQIQVQLLSHWGDDRTAAEAAWASSTDQTKLATKTENDVKRVVSQLVALGHDTPKEAVWFNFFITCPIFVERQIDKVRMSTQYQDVRIECEVGEFGRHGITQNELSGRYRTIPERPYVFGNDVDEILLKARTPKDRSITAPPPLSNRSWFYGLLDDQHAAYKSKLEYLKAAEVEGRITNTEYKRAREVLRGVLGTAFMTDMRMVLNLNALEHVLNQRLAPEAQLEARVVALGMLREVEKAGVAKHAISEMSRKHGWEGWAIEVEAYVEADKS